MAQKRIQKTKKLVKRGSGNEAATVTEASTQRSARLVAKCTTNLAAIDAVLASNRRS